MAAYSPSRGFGYAVPRNDDVHEETTSFLSSFAPFGLEDLQKEKPIRRTQRAFLLGTACALAVLGAVLFGLGIAYYVRRRGTFSLDSGFRAYNCSSKLEPSPEDIAFFVVGDWGRMGSASQMAAARLMEQVAVCIKPQFIISTGDNFYPYGIGARDDPQIKASFTDVYLKSASLRVPWYSVLGNHDYGDQLPFGLIQSCGLDQQSDNELEQCKPGCCFSPLWQVRGEASKEEAHMVPEWHLEQGAHKMSFGNSLEIAFIDTPPFIKKYHSTKWANLLGGISSRKSSIDQQRLLIEGMLNSSAPVKIVIGHHPVVSYGEHCHGDGTDCKDMEWIKPMLEKYKVMAYMSGHEHDMQYFQSPAERTVDGSPHSVSYVVSGAGSDVRAGEFDVLSDQERPEGTNLLRADQGFVAAVVRKEKLILHYFVEQEGAEEPALSVARCASAVKGPCLATDSD